MLFAIYCIDKPDTAAAREKHLKEHREYLDKYVDKIFFSGPLQTDDASASIGSLFVVNVKDKAEAQAYIENETFYQNGIFDKVTITRMRKGRFRADLVDAV